MAGFLPQVDRLQKLLANDFDKQLELAKAVKSKQVAEQYLPALLQAKTFEEARNIQGLVTTEAAKYGLNDLSAKINPIFDAKTKEFDQREKVQKGQGKIGSLFQTYSGYKMKFPHDPTKLVDVGTYINAWVKGQGGIDSIGAYTNADELESAIKANITTEVTEAGLMGDSSRPVITVRKSAKSSYGANVPESFAMYRWDDKNNILWDDLNKNDKYDEGEPLGDQNDDEVKKQIQTFKNMKKVEFDQYAKQQDIAQGWTSIQQRDREFYYKVERDKKGDLEVKLTQGGALDIKANVLDSLRTTHKIDFLSLKNWIETGKFKDVNQNYKTFNPRSTGADIDRILDVKVTDTQMRMLQSEDPKVREEALLQLQSTIGSIGEGTLKMVLSDLTDVIEGMKVEGVNLVAHSDYKRMANDIYFAMAAQSYAAAGVPLPATFWLSVPYPEVTPDATKSVFDNSKANYGAFVKQYDPNVSSNTTPHQYVKPK